jgi:hypothetical protein
MEVGLVMIQNRSKKNERQAQLNDGCGWTLTNDAVAVTGEENAEIAAQQNKG